MSKKNKKKNKSLVAILMGSDSDLHVMKAAAEALKLFQVSYEMKVISAHRTPKEMSHFSESAHKKGFEVIIAGAGGAAHLPGMLAAQTPLPVIGVPVVATELKGLDSLLSVVQMPKGVPVATVAVNNAFNAGLLAVQILSTADKKLQSKILSYKEGLRKMVLKKRVK